MMGSIKLIFHHDISQILLEKLDKVSATKNNILVLYAIKAPFYKHR